MVGLLTFYAMFESSSADVPTSVEYVLAFAVLILCLHFSVNEAGQVASSKKLVDYIFDFWNILDFLALTSILVAFAFKYLGPVGRAVPWFALALVFNYLNTLYFMQGFKESGQVRVRKSRSNDAGKPRDVYAPGVITNSSLTPLGRFSS